MITYQIVGGNPPSEVGLFQQISETNQAFRELLQALADDSSSAPLVRAMAAGTLYARDIVAYRFSPVLTGTLRASHRAIVESYYGSIVGTVYIDEDVINPVYHTRPAVYGMDVLMLNPWPDHAMAYAGDDVLNRIAETSMDALVEIIV